jgi:hypothetical protein
MKEDRVPPMVKQRMTICNRLPARSSCNGGVLRQSGREPKNDTNANNSKAATIKLGGLSSMMDLGMEP